MSRLNYITSGNPIDENVVSITRAFTEFLTAEHGDSEYQKLISKLVPSDEKRLLVSLDKIRTRLGPQYHRGILQDPGLYLEGLTRALLEVAKEVALSESLPPIAPTDEYFIGLTGSFGDHFVSPRSLTSNFLGQSVCVEGIVARCTISRPKVTRSVHYCETTKAFLYKDYRDATTATSDKPSTTATYPIQDDNGNPLMTEFGMSIYKDHQSVTIQEMPERAPPGQLPRSIDVILDNDLVDKVKPGDRVRISGTYRSLGSAANTKNSHSAVFKTVVIANHVRLIGTKSSSTTDCIPTTVKLEEADVKNIRSLATKRKKKIVDLLGMSLMPSIFGHEYIKKAILLMLLGGMEKNLANGTHIRGDINILMVGDPSTAKSQVLRYVLNMANLAVATTGRGSSGVGLTAAVTTDSDTGERRLEAGAMVLADRGIVCIDEFDKMSEVDRVAIHEVMEQQTVTISKAGIHTSLNARCSVLAAANPVYGQYDETKDPNRNIALPDSLLSRFDLLFIVLDKMDEVGDRAIAEHVLAMHRYVAPGVLEGEPTRPIDGVTLDVNDLYTQDVEGKEGNSTVTTPVFERNHTSKNAGLPKRSSDPSGPRDLLTAAFLKKYIYYAKANIQPTLTPPAAEKVKEAYTDLRNGDLLGRNRRTSPVTARTLETLIRLATAHAKARLSTKVEVLDVDSANELMRFAMFKEVTIKKKKQKPRKPDDPNKRKKKDQSHATPSQGTQIDRADLEAAADEEEFELTDEEEEEEDDEEEDEEDEEEEEDLDTVDPNGFLAGQPVDDARLDIFRQHLHDLSEQAMGETMFSFDEVLSGVNRSLPNTVSPYSEPEAVAILEIMQRDNQIMYRDRTIYFI